MSRVASPTLEPVPVVPRRRRTAKRRRAIWIAHGGLCGLCRLPVPLGEMELDHTLALFHGGQDTDDNLRPLHRACHRGSKTPDDAGPSAKIRRLIAREDGTRRERKPIPSRGFRKDIRQRMDGRIEKVTT